MPCAFGTRFQWKRNRVGGRNAARVGQNATLTPLDADISVSVDVDTRYILELVHERRKEASGRAGPAILLGGCSRRRHLHHALPKSRLLRLLTSLLFTTSKILTDKFTFARRSPHLFLYSAAIVGKSSSLLPLELPRLLPLLLPRLPLSCSHRA